MTDHHKPSGPNATDTEPAAVAEVVRVVLAALVAAGWIAIPAPIVNAIVSLVGLAVSVFLTRWTRSRVTPVAPAARSTAAEH